MQKQNPIKPSTLYTWQQLKIDRSIATSKTKLSSMYLLGFGFAT